MLNMNILTALALLKRLLDDVPRLKRLASNPKNEELPTWDNEVRRIIKETFGLDSKEYARYGGIILLKRVKSQADKEQAYIDHVSQLEKALKDIIQEHDLPAKVEAHTDGRGNIKAELEHFYDDFIRYRELVMAKKGGSLTSKQESELQTLSVQLQRRYGSLKEVIEKYGGPSVVPLQGGNREYEAFSSAFNYTIFSPGALTAVMDTAITTLNAAIGNLEKPLEPERLSIAEVLNKKKVFLGSTSNDLKDVRAELRQLIPALGFKLICFEDPSFKKLPGKHAHDMCLDNVPDCDIYVLIIDERFGEEYAGSDPNLKGKSITWAEVEVALRETRVICTFVRKEVWNEKATYSWNMKKKIEIEPFYAKDKRVFQFIEYIATQSKDNWIDQFQDVVELKELIRKRLGMLPLT